MSMDLEKRARRQSLRVIISESIMVITVILTVIILALIVSGYWLNSDFKVERQGMLQINSIPTGANITVDGDSPWFQRTNTSKILSSGKHEVVLSKDGYDTWSKTVNIREGLLYRLNYPQLFLKNRVKEAVYDTAATTYASVSPNRKLLLLANNTTSWSLINLDSDTIRATTLDVTKVFFTASSPSITTGLFDGKIISAKWDSANEHVLLKVDRNESVEWVLLDIRNTAKSINLTREFATEFEDVNIFDHSAENLLAIRNGNLHKIDVNTRQISAIILSDVQDYDFYDSEIVFSSKDHVGLLKLGDSEPTTIEMITDKAKVLIGKFYDNKYIYVIEGANIKVYQKNDLTEILDSEISFIPSEVKIGHGGEFVNMSLEGKIAALDMESMALSEWSAGANNFGWLNSYMIYSVENGELSVFDFDGLNHRVLAKNVSSHFPVTITSEKWLYYFSDGELVREWLIVR